MFAMAIVLGLPAFSHAAPFLAVAGTLAYIASFSLGVGPLPALLVPEMTNTSIRGEQFVVCECILF